MNVPTGKTLEEIEAEYYAQISEERTYVPTGKTLEEMIQIVEAEYYAQTSEQRNRDDEQRAKAPALLESLRRHLPVEVLREVEELLSNDFARDCFREAVQRDLARTKLRETLPAERWGEIEQLVDREVPKAQSAFDSLVAWLRARQAGPPDFGFML